MQPNLLSPSSVNSVSDLYQKESNIIIGHCSLLRKINPCLCREEILSSGECISKCIIKQCKNLDSKTAKFITTSGTLDASKAVKSNTRNMAVLQVSKVHDLNQVTRKTCTFTKKQSLKRKQSQDRDSAPQNTMMSTSVVVTFTVTQREQHQLITTYDIVCPVIPVTSNLCVSQLCDRQHSSQNFNQNISL